MTSSNPFTEFLKKFTTDYHASAKSDLHRAAVKGDVELLHACLTTKDVQIDLEDENGNTPLYMAVQNNNLEVAKILINQGASVNTEGCAPLRIVGKYEMAVLLVESGADVNSADIHGNTPLHRVVMRGNETLVEYLLESGSDIQKKNKDGMNALHHACKHSSDKDRLKVVDLLIKHGCPINVIDNLKRTPLHFACQNTKTDQIIGLLLDQGAKQTEQDFKGLLPIHYLLDQFYLLDHDHTDKFILTLSKMLETEGCNKVIDASGKLHFISHPRKQLTKSFLSF